MKKTFNFLALSLAIFISACSSDDEKGSTPPKAEPIVIKADLRDKPMKDNNFALDLFKTTTSQINDEANIFVSPLSVSMALSMTLNGAAGTTKSEMQTALRNSDYSIDQINEYSKTLREALLKVDTSTQFSIANSIWYRNNFSVESSFINTNKLNYNAEIKSIDFTKPEAVTQINNWCANNTNNKIPSIIDQIPDGVVMYLINAVYFKGIWVQKFEKKNTVSEPFYAENNTTQNIQMMSQKSTLAYAYDENSTYLELPYGNEAFSMIVILPQEGKTITNVIENLSSDSWNAALSKLSPKTVNLHLPRFKFAGSYLLNDKVLPKMGMNTPFNPTLADFSGINKSGDLFISKVIHKTFIEVNEEGSEAVAVTGTEMKTTTIEPNKELNFIVNKPFIFAIKEKSTGIILFMGKVGKIVQ